MKIIGLIILITVLAGCRNSGNYQAEESAAIESAKADGWMLVERFGEGRGTVQNTLIGSSTNAGYLVGRATINGKLEERDIHLHDQPLYLVTFISDGDWHWTLIFRKKTEPNQTLETTSTAVTSAAYAAAAPSVPVSHF